MDFAFTAVATQLSATSAVFLVAPWKKGILSAIGSLAHSSFLVFNVAIDLSKIDLSKTGVYSS
jgi:hypothetical protein